MVNQKSTNPHTDTEAGPRQAPGLTDTATPPSTPTYKPFDVAREPAYENQISIQK